MHGANRKGGAADVDCTEGRKKTRGQVSGIMTLATREQKRDVLIIFRHKSCVHTKTKTEKSTEVVSKL